MTTFTRTFYRQQLSTREAVVGPLGHPAPDFPPGMTNEEFVEAAERRLAEEDPIEVELQRIEDEEAARAGVLRGPGIVDSEWWKVRARAVAEGEGEVG